MYVCMYVCMYVFMYVCMYVCMFVCVYVRIFLIDINSMPHYIVILRALHNYLSFVLQYLLQLIITKTIDEIHYNFYKNIFDV